jgi:hypothetical protein
MGCAIASTIGTCTNLPLGATDPVHACLATNVCNGSGACLLANGQACTGDAQCASSNCNLSGGSGNGKCN